MLPKGMEDLCSLETTVSVTRVADLQDLDLERTVSCAEMKVRDAASMVVICEHHEYYLKTTKPEGGHSRDCNILRCTFLNKTGQTLNPEERKQE